MERAKAAVAEFIGKPGHDTTVDERQAPAIKHEQVQPVRHEEVTTAIDREVHQDHYHTTVQPVKDREVLPEKHVHQMAGVQNKEFEHARPEETRARLEREAAQFRDTSTTLNTKTSQAVAPTVEGERIHHHVHEVVQPVIEKETIAPTVVHTTVPVHESHHAAPEHHGTSVLPVKTVAEFKASGQSLTGSTGVVNQDHYEGCPRPYNKDMQLGTTEADVNPHMHTSPIGSTHTHGATNAGPHNSNMMNKADPRVDSDLDGRGIGAGATGLGAGATGAGMTGNRSPNTPTGPQSPGMGNKLDPRVDSNRDGRGLQHTTSTASSASSMSDTNPHKKPSLLDRLNPMKDADHDGKKGFLR